MRISLNPEDFIQEQFEIVRAGGIFNMTIKDVDYEVTCEPNFVNVNFVPIKGVTNGGSTTTDGQSATQSAQSAQPDERVYGGES